MICSSCKTEFDNGLLYCPKCGHAVQIVPDYNLLDEDILPSMLAEPKNLSEDKGSEKAEENKFEGNKSSKTTKSNKKVIVQNLLKYLIPIVIVALVVIFIFRFLDEYNYRTLVTRGETYIENESYEQALNVLRNAYKEKEEDDVLYLIAKAEILSEDYKNAVNDLKTLISNNPDNIEYYKLLVPLYYEMEEYEAISELKDSITSKDILQIFDDYTTEEVDFSLTETSYDENQTLILSSSNGYDIFYTINGEDPTDGNGMRYQKPIELREGTTVVSATAVSESGNYGPVNVKRYTIKYKIPEEPTVTPAAGIYSGEQVISITAEDYMAIYYTWDGSTPTKKSMHYIIPISIEPGNNILSVVAYDEEHDLYSSVVRVNYICQ